MTLRSSMARAAGACLAMVCAVHATAAESSESTAYPTRPIRMVVPFAPGGASDFIGRILQPKLVEALGQQVVVENRSGASGNVGVEVAAQATPDGYTWLLGNVGTMAINPSIFPKFPIRANRDFVPVTLVVDVPGALGVYGALPVSNMADFIAYVKERPNKLNYGSSGLGSAQALAFEFFMSKAGIRMTAVPYKGGAGAATIATLAGEVAATMVTTASLVPHAKTGKIKVLAVVAKKRIPALPDTPTMIELGYPELNLGSWQGMYLPRGVPRSIVDRLFKVITQIVHDPWVAERYEKVSAQAVTSESPAEFGRFMQEQNQFWAQAIKTSGLKPQD